MARSARHTLRQALGFLLGTAIGVVVLGGIGVLALDHSTGLLWGVAFFVSFVGMLFGIVAPLALIRYLGGHGRSRVAKQLSTAGGYVAVIVVTVLIAAVGLFLAPPAVSRNPQVGLVAFDVVAGAVFGGIIGHDTVSKRI